jgi:hypothetical protein
VNDSAEPGALASTFERLHEALQGQDLDVVVSLLDPEVEVIGMKGVFRGPDDVRRWATKSEDGSLYSLVEVDDVREVAGDHVAVQARRVWHWREGDEVADVARFGALFRFRDGRVWRWRQDYPSIVEAIEAVPLD